MTVTSLATAQQPPAAIAAPNASPSALAEIWKHAKMLASSDIVPKAYQGKPENCVIAIELSARLGSSPMLVMQSLDIIQGKPSWSSKFLIASVNSSGKFSPIRYRFTGKARTKDWGCVAYATDKDSGEILEGPLVDMQMAADEGWLNKPGSKWKTMPQLMLMYRSAAFWSRVYCPEVSMGLHTTEEREDLIQVTSMRSGGMPEEIHRALLADGTTVQIPETIRTESLENSDGVQAEPEDDQREPGQEG